jgi:phosphopantothenoylcysteine decarboxylase/phosphopantothenate--cysteine ligase
MNVRMWTHPATQRNLALLKSSGISFIGPNEGEMACGEFGPGRMAEPLEILAAIENALHSGPLSGRTALVTAGPTHEPLDPVRFLSNRSSGKQGYAIAGALAAAGAQTTLVSGPVEIDAPQRVKLVRVETAREMLSACESALPVDVAVCTAAVADWRPEAIANQKLKKEERATAVITLAENPDILASISHAARRPALVVGFAAETEDVVAHARAKRARKGCDWIVANDVSPGTGIMGGNNNRVHLITGDAVEDWPLLDKAEVGKRLAARIAGALSGPPV